MPTLDMETSDHSGAPVAAAHTGKRVLLAEPRGYCAGVDRAVETVERALEKHGAPVYVRHEIVHNKHVVDTLTNKGVVF
ncbi:MAG: 4-hydroxy-3-methylbut-2-enyl diphosphate reductase, partial [Mycobacterium sp.]